MVGAVLNEKLESLRRCIQRVESTCPDSAQQLAENVDAQDIVTPSLTRAIQLVVHSFCTDRLEDFRSFARIIASLQ